VVVVEEQEVRAAVLVEVVREVFAQERDFQ
jgi:hypothetical protein